jgi:glycerol-3-phosphate dehydrogenase (NAD(P)+)
MRISVVGAGAWGTALAAVAARGGEEVLLWAREPEVVREINARHQNPQFLPGSRLPRTIRASTSLAAAAEADALLLAAPAQHLRTMASALAGVVLPGKPIVICAKGLEQTSGLLMSEVLLQAFPAATPAVLSGPSFASEVAEGKPTAVTLAIADRPLGEALVARLGQSTFRPYLTDDLVGAQLGGAVKNVLAIACGIVDGRGLGESARAALITRGFAEMTRLALACGARAETLSGLSGLGDLILTATSARSRNYRFGQALGRGTSVKALAADTSVLAEGTFTASALSSLARNRGVEMPISAAVDAILREALTIDGAIEALLTRPFRQEN